jgi:hypothetical protein
MRIISFAAFEGGANNDSQIEVIEHPQEVIPRMLEIASGMPK